MALTYAEQATLAASAPWQARVGSAVADVAQSQIRTLPTSTNFYTALIRLSVQVLTDPTTSTAVVRLVAAGLPGTVTLSTPPENTATDAQIKAQVRNAFDALVTF